MAITSNGTGGGVWSAGASWAGGVAPGNNDTVIIAAGDTLTVDSDFSAAWADGVAGITITSHATTPGLLRFKWDADATYSLKVKTGGTIAGTNAAAKGRLLANSDGVWGNTGSLPYTTKAIIDLAGTTAAYIDAQYLDIALYGTEPANLSAEVYGSCYTVTAEADDDKLTFTSTPSATPPQNGTPITMSSNGGDLPGGLSAGTTYFIRDVSGATCKLESSIGGGAIDLTTDGTGTLYVHYGKWGPVDQAANVNTTTGVVTWNGVPPAAGTPVRVRSSGTLPTGFQTYHTYYTRAISGNTCKLALQNSDATIVIPSAVGSGNISMYCGTATGAYATAAVNVATNVSADTPWVTTDGYDYAVLVNAGAPSTYDQQRLQLTTIDAAGAYIVLSAAVDSAQYPGAQLWLSSRNVSIRSATTSSSGNIVAYASGSTHGGTFACEIRASAGTGTTFYGYGIYYGVGVAISGGAISGCNYGINGSTGATVSSGTITGCNYGISSSTGATVSGGAISGCNCGIYVSTGATVSGGAISGCNYGINGSTGATVSSGTITGCNYGISSSTGATVSGGAISGCYYGIGRIMGATVSGGAISGCNYGIYNSAGWLGMATFSGNAQDISMLESGPWVGNGTALNSTTQVANYKHVSQEKAESRNGVMIQDFGGTAEHIGAWTLGGYCKTAAYSAGTHGTPPVANDYIHEMTFEDSDRLAWVEYPIWVIAGQEITVTFYGKLSGTSAWTTRPSIGIYDPTQPWQGANEDLDVETMLSNTDWQTLTVTYTAAHDRELRVRVQGVGGNAGGTGTEKLYWFLETSLGGSGGGGGPVIGSRIIRGLGVV